MIQSKKILEFANTLLNGWAIELMGGSGVRLRFDLARKECVRFCTQCGAEIGATRLDAPCGSGTLAEEAARIDEEHLSMCGRQ